MTRVGIVDYGLGNRRSVEKALEHVGADPVLSSDPEMLAQTDGLIVPGVGAFPEGMRRLTATGLDRFVIERARAGVPVLGICLGMQLLFERSSEFEGADGLGLLAGEVTQLRVGERKLPHIGWNLVSMKRPAAIVSGLGAAAAFYHVHSYVCRPSDPGVVVGVGEYGEMFPSIVEGANVMGVQFHPEKSSAAGLSLLRNFVSTCAAVPATGA